MCLSAISSLKPIADPFVILLKIFSNTCNDTASFGTRSDFFDFGVGFHSLKAMFISVMNVDFIVQYVLKKETIKVTQLK